MRQALIAMSCVALAKAPIPASSENHAELAARLEHAQCHQDRPEQQLHRHDPLLALAQPAQAGKIDLVDQRRPQELEGIGQPDERKDAHRFQIDLGFGQPGEQRAEKQRERQAAGKAEQQHEAGLAIGQR